MANDVAAGSFGGDVDAEKEVTPGLGEEDVPGFPSDVCPAEMPDLSAHHSYVANILLKDPRMYHRLRDRRTSRRVGLARCIKAGMDNLGHRMVKSIGLIAGDEESYDTFRELFDPIIEAHLTGGMARQCGADLGRIGVELTTGCADPTGRYVVSSQVSAARSLRGFCFPPAMLLEERCQVENLLAAAVLNFNGPLRGDYFPLRGSSSWLGGMTEDEEASLQRAGMLLEAPDSRLQLCTGAFRNWPHGRGVFVSRSRSLVAWLNGQEHFHLASTKPGDGVQVAFQELVDALDAVASSLRRNTSISSEQKVFAHSDRLGFLTSSPTNLGSALRVSVVARLPQLSRYQLPNRSIAKLQGGRSSNAWCTWCWRQHVNVTRATRATHPSTDATASPADAESLNEADGCLFEISNMERLGISGVETVNLVVGVVARLVHMEVRLESSHPIEDLLESDVVSSGSAVASAAAADAGASAEKAVCSFAMRLVSEPGWAALDSSACAAISNSQTPTAASTVATATAAGERPPTRSGPRSDDQSAAASSATPQDTAELAFSSILRSVVEDPNVCESTYRLVVKEKQDEEAAEVVYAAEPEETAGLVFDSIWSSIVKDPTLSRNEQDAEVVKIEEWPPAAVPVMSTDSSQAISSVQDPSSGSAAYQLAAAEMLDDIVEASIDRRTSEIEQGAREVATQVVANVARRSLNRLSGEDIASASVTQLPDLVSAAPAEAPKMSQQDMEDLRGRAQLLFLNAVEEGTFEQTLAEVAQVEVARAKAKDAIVNCLDNGSLEEALRSVVAESTVDREAASHLLNRNYTRCSVKAETRRSLLSTQPPSTVGEITQVSSAEQSLDDLRVMAGNHLFEAAATNRLDEVLGNILSPSDAQNEQGTDNIGDLRRRACDVLVASAGDGSLQQYVEESADIDELRRRACNILSASVDDGSLRQSIEASVSASSPSAAKREEGTDIHELRRRACNILSAGAEDGSLQQSVEATLHTSSPSAAKREGGSDVDELRRRACESLGAAADSGTLFQSLQCALGATAAEDESGLPPPFLEKASSSTDALRGRLAQIFLMEGRGANDLETAFRSVFDQPNLEKERATCELKVSVCEALAASLESGSLFKTLESVLLGGAVAPNKDALAEDAPNAGDAGAPSEGALADALAEDDVVSSTEVLRDQARVMLEDAFDSGRLDRVLAGKATSDAPVPPTRAQKLAALKKQACDSLGVAADNGELAGVLGPAAEEARNGTTSIEGEKKRQEMRNFLMAATESGELLSALEELRIENRTRSAKTAEPDAVQSSHLPMKLPPTPRAIPATSLEKTAPTKAAAAFDLRSIEAQYAKAPALVMFQVISQRIQRSAALEDMIKQTERQIAMREQNCKDMEKTIESVKLDLYQLEMDIDWNTRALMDAEGRRQELEDNHRKLNLVDLSQLRSTGLSTDGDTLAFQTTRSELSTTAGDMTATG